MIDPVEFLTPADRAGLKRLCDMLGISLHTWRRVPFLRECFETMAVETEADRIQERTGCKRERAVRQATADLGIALTTHRNRTDRAWVYSFNPERDR